VTSRIRVDWRNGLLVTERTPIVYQSEAAECGLACLAMVAGHYGGDIGLADLRSIVQPSARGVNLAQLTRAARRIGLSPRPVKVSNSKGLHKLALPCVLHWEFNHFVVLVRLTRKHITIHDPAVGIRRLPIGETESKFTGVALTLLPNSEFRRGIEANPVSARAVVGEIAGLRGALASMLLLGLGVEAALVAMPFYLQWVLDQSVPMRDVELLNLLAVAFLAVAILHAVLTGIRAYAVARVGADFNFQWSVNTFARLLQLPVDFFSRRTLGSISSRFESIAIVQKAISAGIAESFVDGLLVVGTLVMMLLYGPELALMSVVALLAYGILRVSMYPAMTLASHEVVLSAAKQKTSFIEAIRGIQTLRLYGKEDERAVSWSHLLADQFNSELRLARSSSVAKSIGALILNAERILVVWLAAHSLMRSSMSLGMLVAYLAYREQFVTRGFALIDKAVEFTLLRVHIARIADIALATPEVAGRSDANLSSVPASLQVAGLCFSYGENEEPVLRGVSFHVDEGECVAITGPSGCGKTTLGKVIVGLLQPGAGEIRIGGIDVRKLSLYDRRMLFGTVMQDDMIFAGSIVENITFFDPAADPDWAMECASACGLIDEINQMPMRFHTLVGDTGGSLSGGQRQRLLLARALYRRPRILLLDEATSQLDTHNERRIGEAVAGLKMTRIVIAHRLETIALCDRVITLGNQ
jgi:ATP-binding cassette, subfamily B, bacterial CvaB/MchF/RaxB